MIKDNVGKDLTRVCLPVYFNEPISSLQKCCEDMEYSYLLDRAYEHGKMGKQSPKGSKCCLHLRFLVMHHRKGGTVSHSNPLLGETYEADYPIKESASSLKGWVTIVLQVSHHPTLIACHCEGRGVEILG
ncbi:hypothetical protein M0R45_024700 [Rubus argutus]|uniref:Uncharacterized protein n=1 Tax=Rubus argutus TaxID=59490 RepID=A0AAW1WRT1_RUBAR